MGTHRDSCEAEIFGWESVLKDLKAFPASCSKATNYIYSRRSTAVGQGSSSGPQAKTTF